MGGRFRSDGLTSTPLHFTGKNFMEGQSSQRSMKTIPALLALAFVPSAFAHDTCIAPDQFGRCGAVTLHMTSAPEFGRPETAIEPSRVRRAVIMTPHRRLDMKPVAAKSS